MATSVEKNKTATLPSQLVILKALTAFWYSSEQKQKQDI